MKKITSIFLLSVFAVVAAIIPTNAGCPQGGGSCTGVCVGIYGSGGTITSYKCDTGATAEKKDCTPSEATMEIDP